MGVTTLVISNYCLVLCLPVFFNHFRLEVWPGYITSVCENEGGLMLLADASHRVLRTETVLQML